MKAVAFNGSARKNGNTAILISKVFSELEKEGISCERIDLAGELIRGCTACRGCINNKNRRCALDNDIINTCLGKMEEAQIIIIGSPTYFAGVTAETKALIDRTGYVARANNNMFSRKIGASVAAVRRAGALNVFNTINHFFFISNMIVPGSSYWNIGIGRDIGDVEKDEEGMLTMKTLGENLAWLAKSLYNK